ncbi:hypothetical protein BKA62DRAFT_724337 [Auriculariales sp. MPI-PUGE-AT-0066]|nr:hypothetical protein BKA62DRAFT_724337 [Auriculariales sp. MPI-PUGE-AT-0066]
MPATLLVLLRFEHFVVACAVGFGVWRDRTLLADNRVSTLPHRRTELPTHRLCHYVLPRSAGCIAFGSLSIVI